MSKHMPHLSGGIKKGDSALVDPPTGKVVQSRLTQSHPDMPVSVLGLASAVPDTLAPPSHFDRFAKKWTRPSAA